MNQGYLVELNCSNHDLALAEVDAVGEVTQSAYGVAVSRYLDVERGLGMAHRVLEYMGRTDPEPDRDSVLSLVESFDYGFEGSFRVRVGSVGESEPTAVERLESAAGGVIEGSDRTVDLDDPDEEFRLVFSQDTERNETRCYYGRLLTETESFEGRQPTEKPFFKPGSMSPSRARALVNIARGYGTTLLDPACGTGGVLLEGVLVQSTNAGFDDVGITTLGFDSQHEMVEGARRNLRHYSSAEGFGLGVADARNLPLGDDSVGAGVADLPYGRASLVDADSLDSLNREVLAEFHRVVRGRVVVVSDGYLVDEAREAGFDVLDVIEDRVHRSLTRHVHVLE